MFVVTSANDELRCVSRFTKLEWNGLITDDGLLGIPTDIPEEMKPIYFNIYEIEKALVPKDVRQRPYTYTVEDGFIPVGIPLTGEDSIKLNSLQAIVDALLIAALEV